MKNLILISVLFFAFSCKKKSITPTPVPVTPQCASATKLAVGKWRNNACNHDTINVVFYSANCDNTAEQYYCYNLNKAVQPCVSTHTLDFNYQYGLIINEAASPKQGTVGGYTGSFVRLENDSTLYIEMPNEGDFYFTKIK